MESSTRTVIGLALAATLIVSSGALAEGVGDAAAADTTESDHGWCIEIAIPGFSFSTPPVGATVSVGPHEEQVYVEGQTVAFDGYSTPGPCFKHLEKPA